MHLVHDVDAVFAADRSIRQLILEQMNVLHLVVAGGVHLYDIRGGAVCYLAAALALKAGIAVHRVLAVERHRENFRAGGLTCSAASGEEIRVGVLPGRDLIFQGGDYLRLGYYIVKSSRTVFTVQRKIHKHTPFQIKI